MITYQKHLNRYYILKENKLKFVKISNFIKYLFRNKTINKSYNIVN